MQEEFGIDEQAVVLGVQLAERSMGHLVGGHQVRQVEKCFLGRVDAAAVDPAWATQSDNIRESRWWTVPDLRRTKETVYPEGLAGLVARVRDGRIPLHPVVLG